MKKMNNEIKFLKYFKHKLEECGLEDTYLNDIIKCRKIIEARIKEVQSRESNGLAPIYKAGQGGKRGL